MTDIFRDVDEAVRRERYLYLWRRYGPLSLGVLGCAVFLFGALFFWVQSARESRRDASLAFDKALGLKSAAPQLQALADLREQDDLYGELALFHRAAILARAERRREALALYEALEKAEGVSQTLRDLAGIHAASLMVGIEDFAEIERRLAPSLQDGAPFIFSAKETLALAAIAAGKEERAYRIYKDISESDAAPPSMIERAKIMLSSSLKRPAPASLVPPKP